VYILDTDVISNVIRHGQGTDLGLRLSLVPSSKLFISIVTAQELLGGRISSINSEKNPDRLLLLYSLFSQTIQYLRGYKILPFDEAAQAAYQAIPNKIRQRAGTMDCRIAATAMVRDFIVITCNTGDFHLIPNLKFEDWSKPIA
jgi:predicted nucleic acid-binding protein